jgi:hypothetical protein
VLCKVTNLLTLNCLTGDIFNDTDSNHIFLERQIIARYRAMNSKDMEETEGEKQKQQQEG